MKSATRLFAVISILLCAFSLPAFAQSFGQVWFGGSPPSGCSEYTLGLDASAADVYLCHNGAYKKLMRPDSTDTLTNKTLDTAGTGNVMKLNGTTVTNTLTDGYFFIGPEDCSISQASGTETVASVRKIVGNIPMVQETTTTTTATHTVVCSVRVPSKLTAGHGVTINDVVLLYGNSTGTIATINAPTVGTVTGVAAGTSETPASATLVTAGGSLTVTPVVGSGNTAAVSAGQFYTEKIAFGTPIVLNTDQQVIYITQSFVGPTNATFTLNVAGLYAHFTNVPL